MNATEKKEKDTAHHIAQGGTTRNLVAVVVLASRL